MYPASAGGYPAGAAPTYQQQQGPPPTMYGQPPYGQNFNQPPYGQPGQNFNQPPYGQPGYGQNFNQPPPSYGQPPYGQPGQNFNQPPYGQPGYGQNFNQPQYGQNFNSPPPPGSYGAPPTFTPPVVNPAYNQGPYPGQSPVQQWGGAPAPGFGAQPPPPQNLTWSEPLDMEIPSCDGDQFEMKKLIAREYNNSPASSGDHISSQNIEILGVQPRGQNARVNFRVNDGQFPPDPQERGVLKWIILGGIAAGIAYKINQSRKRKGGMPGSLF